jgi:integrase
MSSRSVQIAHNSLRRSIRYAEADGKVGRNVAALVDTPKGRTGRRRRGFTLGQAAALIAASRVLPDLPRHAGLKDPRRPASLMHAYIAVSLMAGVRPEEARAIRWREDVALQGVPPSVAVLRADRAGGDTKTRKSRRALKLAQTAVAALEQWEADQAAECAAAGARWEDHGLVFTTAAGAPMEAKSIRRMFKDVCERARLIRENAVDLALGLPARAHRGAGRCVPWHSRRMPRENFRRLGDPPDDDVEFGNYFVVDLPIGLCQILPFRVRG